MIILTIRTDKPEAEIGLYDNDKQLAYEKWQAHRKLSETIHHKIAKNLQSVNKDWGNIEGIIVFRGPGSFTGLRIGLSVANAAAYSQGVPIVSISGKSWIANGIEQLLKGENETVTRPDYGGEAYTTRPRK